jgi:hypothetical protein
LESCTRLLISESEKGLDRAAARVGYAKKTYTRRGLG